MEELGGNMKIVQITINGSTCSWPADDLDSILEDIKSFILYDDEPSEMTISLTEMEEDKFKKLPEFQGY
jgi:hypothetical protein